MKKLQLSTNKLNDEFVQPYPNTTRNKSVKPFPNDIDVVLDLEVEEAEQQNDENLIDLNSEPDKNPVEDVNLIDLDEPPKIEKQNTNESAI